MANLLGQNIGTNYKGILNLNTLNGNLSATLQAVTDGDGNASLLQLSTSQAAFSGFSGAPAADIVWRANPTLTDYTGWHQSDGTYRIITKNSAPLFVNISNNVSFLNGFAAQSVMTGNGALGLGLSTGLSARLHVRGDGTNPIARFEESTGTRMFLINNAQLEFGSSAIYGSIAFPTSTALTPDINGLALAFRSQNTLAGTTDRFDFSFIGGNVANTAGTVSHFHLSRIFAAAAGSANFRPLNIAYTINNSGAQTGTATGIFLNATETALNGMTHNLMDLQTGGVSRFKISVTDATVTTSYNISAAVFLGNSAALAGTGGVKVGNSRIRSDADANLTLLNDAANNFSLLKFGGTTSAFPALKRNAAALEVRLADDSDFANLGAKEISASVGFFAPNSTEVRGNYIRGRSSTYMNFSSGTPGVVIDSSGASSASASAILQADSTTKGFLPPRMTTAQRDLIATPAAGLVIYNTTTNVLNFYNGTAWAAV